MRFLGAEISCGDLKSSAYYYLVVGLIVGFPKFNFNAVGVDDVCKAAIVEIFYFAYNGYAIGAQFFEQRGQVFDPEIEHKIAATGCKMGAVGRHRAPLGETRLVGGIGPAPFEIGAPGIGL